MKHALSFGLGYLYTTKKDIIIGGYKSSVFDSVLRRKRSVLVHV